MTAIDVNFSPQRNARIAGALYLTLVPLGFFGLFASSGIVVPGDAVATASHILASEPLFRLSIVVAMLVQIINIFVVLALYRLLKPVDRNMAGLMVIFLLLGVPIAMLNELIQFAVLALAHNTGTLQGFSAGQVQALVPMLLGVHQVGINIAGVFWGLWLFPMGYLVYKSEFLPRILGALLIIGCLGYLVDSFAAFLIPGFSMNVAMFTFWGEVLLPLWLLIKGVNIEKWKKLALASA
ncbi:MAG TPA: DUF4386 domain-containing protein [Anaerolineaceae bacterium]|nr:DUF4386 domain-containing protein [Anaerolineaceae bacterium]